MSAAEDRGSADDRIFSGKFSAFKAVVSGQQLVRVFAAKSGGFEPLREYRCHEMPVTAVSFAPVQHPPYMLTAGVDMKLFLFNLADKGAEPLFDFSEESGDFGCFTVAEFLRVPAEQLRFIVGTSAGIAFLFASDRAFAEEKLLLGRGAVRVIEAGPREAFVSVCEDESPRLFVATAPLDFIEFGEELHASRKVSHAGFAFCGGEEDALLLTADEEGRLGLWRFRPEAREVALLRSFSVAATPSSLCWDLSGFSALVLGVAKEGAPACWRLETGFEPDGEWRLGPVALQGEK